MFKNYFRTAYRNFLHNKQFSLLNISGLALGITVFVFILQYVASEWSANRFNKNYNELYRLNLRYEKGNVDYLLPPGFAPILKNQIPAVESFTRVSDNIGSGVISYHGSTESDVKIFREDQITYVDGNFLSVFSFPIVAGALSLSEPKTLALSENMSNKLFGNTDAIGKTVVISNQFGNTSYRINCVFELPSESDVRAEVLLSINTLENAADREGNDWADPKGTESGFTSIYLQLQKNAPTRDVGGRINSVIRSVNPESKNDEILLQPFRELHLAPSFDYPLQTFGSRILVVSFSGVALLILLIAWINYINLSTAQALHRSKEIGVRKVLGANRIQLAGQYLVETFIFVVAAMILALLLVHLFQPLFNGFTGKNLTLGILQTNWFWIVVLVSILAGSLLAGSYVAFVLTSFKPATILRNGRQGRTKRFTLRKGLVIFQYSVSIIFIISTLVVYKQLLFMQTQQLGMNLNQLMVIEGPTVSSDQQAARNVSFKNSLANLPFITKYTASNNVPGIGYNFFADGISRLNAEKTDGKKSYAMFIADQNFFDTYAIPFVQGGPFGLHDAEAGWRHIHKVILNVKAVQALGLDIKQNLIGQKINWGSPYEIVGIVQNYHHLSLKDPIQPTIYLASLSYSYFTIQTDKRDLPSKIKAIRSLFINSFPDNPFGYFFADEKYDQQYITEKNLGNVFIASAFIAILIACLGLFGLSSFSARQRMKEIGIRKILGANVKDITVLLSKDFIRLVMIALIIASPVASWIMHKWLQNFAFHTEINFWIFFLAGSLAIAIAIFTISLQAIKAAIANPVKNLKTE